MQGLQNSPGGRSEVSTHIWRGKKGKMTVERIPASQPTEISSLDRDCRHGHRRVISVNYVFKRVTCPRLGQPVSVYHINRCSKTYCAQFITVLYCKENKQFSQSFIRM